MNTVEFDVDVVNAVLSGHESYRVVVGFDLLNEAIVLCTGRRNNLEIVFQIRWEVKQGSLFLTTKMRMYCVAQDDVTHKHTY